MHQSNREEVYVDSCDYCDIGPTVPAPAGVHECEAPVRAARFARVYSVYCTR